MDIGFLCLKIVSYKFECHLKYIKIVRMRKRGRITSTAMITNVNGNLSAFQQQPFFGGTIVLFGSADPKRYDALSH